MQENRQLTSVDVVGSWKAFLLPFLAGLA